MAVLLVFGTFLSLAGAGPAARAEEDSNNSIKVDRVSFPVVLSDGSAAQIVGYLYYQGSYHERPLQVLVHGGTYTHTYWDAPTINGVDYSYARYMARQHYAVLAIDQLGSGESTHPPGDFVTLAEAANALHQVLTSLRTDSNPVGYAFPRLALVGHSFGSITATYLLGTYPQDADALVTTGAAHVPSAPPDSLLAVIGLLEATPYASLPPDVRASVYYYAPAADPDMIAYDNANLADPIARGFLNSIFPIQFDDAASRVGLVQGPVLVQLGDHDQLAPAVPAAAETAHWPMAQVTVQMLTDIGHDVNLHLTHLQSWTAIDTWLQAQLAR
jgi:pimeloyl-ACP methyl ester carboxylesterase